MKFQKHGKSRVARTLGLALAGVFSIVPPALAQETDTCPVPAGVTPLAPLRVTAQQVENGSASLGEFALAVKDQFAGLETQEGSIYLACFLREEGTPYHSGSTYVVTLAGDRIGFHSKTVSLGGRQLDPRIVGAILQQALGINPASLADPAAAFAALTAAAAGEGGSFEVPGIPGASGYVVVFLTANGFPQVLFAGFDLNESHLVQEELDYGNPSITAEDVVDRRTLKEFVTQAGEFFLAGHRTLGTAPTNIRLAMRDPNGPWRHGSVYLWVLDLTSDLITFHAAFPNRFEYRPLVATVRDAVTGEFILPQVIAAAKSSPEGGFVEYYFDDPTDDTDSADIPKVGYAREFRLVVEEHGHAETINFIVGSGFYLSDPNVAAARRDTAVESILPQVMRAMTASTVDAVSDRIQRATSGTAAATGFRVGGATTLPEALRTYGQALGNGSFDPGRLLAGSSFNLPLNAADTGGAGLIGDLTLWGRGDFRSFSGGNPQTVDYDGDVVSANLGVDTDLSRGLLAGMAVSWARSTVDYADPNAVTGDITTTLTSFHPYLGWQAPGGMNVWAVAGTGSGEIEVNDDAVGSQASDLTQRMAAAGVAGSLLTSDQLIDGGTTSVRLKGETAHTWVEVDGAGTVQSGKIGVSRQRLMLEGTHVQALASGATLTPSIEVGVRHDGGDGETGTSIEAGGGMRYEHLAAGLTVEARARTLLTHSGDYEEWGASGLVRIDPGAAGVGLALSVRPAWGETSGSVRQLWETGSIGKAAAVHQADRRMHADIAYGLRAPRQLGTVTPYAGIGLADTGPRSWHLGAQWQVAPAASASLEGTRREAAIEEGSEHRLMLHGALRW